MNQPPQTPDTGPVTVAICHGYVSRYPDTLALRLPRAIGRIEPIDPPESADRSE